MSSLHLPATSNRLAGTTSGVPTMSSREIAEVVGSRHDKVKQSIERLAERGVIALPPLGEYLDTLGRKASEYRIGKRDSYVIVAQLSPEFTARLVDRWQELETRLYLPALPDFSNPAVAARAWAEEYERRDLAERQVALLKPKAAALDLLAADDDMILISDGAKRLGMPIKDLFAWLRANRWIFRRSGSKRDIGYADKIRDGLLVHKYRPVPQEDGPDVLKEQVHLTPKGLAHLAAKFDRKDRK